MRDAALIFSVNEERTVARIRFVEIRFGSRRVSKANGGIIINYHMCKMV
jgi:hypothetical protein